MLKTQHQFSSAELSESCSIDIFYDNHPVIVQKTSTASWFLWSQRQRKRQQNINLLPSHVCSKNQTIESSISVMMRLRRMPSHMLPVTLLRKLSRSISVILVRKVWSTQIMTAFPSYSAISRATNKKLRHFVDLLCQMMNLFHTLLKLKTQLFAYFLMSCVAKESQNIWHESVRFSWCLNVQSSQVSTSWSCTLDYGFTTS